MWYFFKDVLMSFFLLYSLEQPSSSSISTTTSSVTSMTSLEHESNDTSASASASDYGADNWDHENWGEMDVSINVVVLLKMLKKFLLYFVDITRSKLPVGWSIIYFECQFEFEYHQYYSKCCVI